MMVFRDGFPGFCCHVPSSRAGSRTSSELEVASLDWTCSREPQSGLLDTVTRSKWSDDWQKTKQEGRELQ